ncbi:hypothetical protein BUALT_Bualt12G0056200 [Buddleja alternifolia]|uniref:Reverse transcriptase zinc-binding domain-containing protein n=1 Tax=Buddleja alternifolia TaxID=168488 RepID=A0AAV6WPB6_9LAMI|nr:hypothetical protein BUALT_Bualt12G0056200 [Buddleja alternifolia]
MMKNASKTRRIIKDACTCIKTRVWDNLPFCPTDKKGGRLFASSSNGGLQNLIDDIGLFDLGFTGYQFTWNNKRDGLANIQQRLDRGLVNPTWTVSFPHSLIRHLLPIASDHSPLLLLTDPVFTTGPKPFRFEEIWVQDPSRDNLALLEAVEVDLDESYKKLETFWHQKSRLKWLRDGDANTKFFHLSSILHRRNNKICEVTTSTGVRTAENLGLINGVKVSRLTPKITHLMYADDLVVYCETNIFNAEAVVNCLDMFESWSGLSVNKQKSSIHFSHNVAPFVKLYIKDILAMKECDHKNKHLGLPFCKHAHRSVCFNDLIVRIGKKLSGWKAKHLSFACRLVVLKSIAQALPTYQLSSFLIPKSILGGLGLRKMEHINQALISKLAWNMAANSPKIWVKMLSAKYLVNNTFFNSSSAAHNSSWTWQDICKVSNLIKASACFVVTHNSHINTWSDPWIPGIAGFIPSRPSLVSSAFDLVHSLIDPITKDWSFDILSTIFPPSTIRAILKIRISSSSEQSNLVWTPTSSGKFSVKSAYASVISYKFQSPHPSHNNPNTIYSLLWKAKIHNRFKVFIWRLLHKSLPTREILGRFIALETNVCPFCHGETESDFHLFLECPFVRQIWEEFLQYSLCFMDLSWKARNRLIHDNEHLQVTTFLKQVSKMAKDHSLAQSEKRVESKLTFSNSAWKKPPHHWIKVNCHSYFQNDSACLAWIFFDSTGSILDAFAFPKTSNSPAQAAIEVLLAAMKVADSHQIGILSSPIHPAANSTPSDTATAPNLNPHSSFLLRCTTSQFFRCDPTVKKLIPFRFKFPYVKILQCCNGLLLLEGRNAPYGRKDYYIYNPTTIQYRKLLIDDEKKKTFSGLCLVFDPSKSSDYQVICFREDLDKYSNWFEVYDFETDTWKHGRNTYCPPKDFCNGIYCNDAIYYIRTHSTSLCFDPNVTSTLLAGKNYICVYEKDGCDCCWFMNYRVDLNPISATFAGKSGKAIIVLGIIRGEEEEDSMLLFHVPGKIMIYWFSDEIFEVLVDFTREMYYREGELQFGSKDSFQFIETLVPV